MTNERTPAWRLLFLLLSAVAMIALLLAAACGGDDDDDGGDDGGATATRDSGDDGGDDSGDDSEATETDDTGDDGGDDGGDDPLSQLEDLAGAYESVDGTVTYTFITDGEESSWTVYSEGDNSRTDFGDGEGSYISITTPEASYTCFDSAGEGTCIPGEGGIGANPFAGIFSAYASADAIEAYAALFGDIDVDTSSEEIAGVDASCYSASGDFDGESGSVKWCFSDEGVLLLAIYDFASGSTEMRASDFDDSVPDGIFEPPYDVAEIPTP